MKHVGKTPPFRTPTGEPLAGSIADIGYVRLGGVEQWVMMRGESTANPPLVLLHGGPGWSETSFFRHFNAALEEHFVVVYWDQRGAGKSFDARIPRESMTFEQFLADLDALVDHVRALLGAAKVALFGHSWGSALGASYAARHPDKVSVYVGSGQIGDWAAGEAASYAFALAEARRLDHRKAIDALVDIGPPPYDASAVFTERTWLQRLEHQLTAKKLWDLGRILLGEAESSIFDLPTMFRGFRWTMDVMWAEVSRLNLLERVPAMQVPVVLFLGRRDHWVPPATSLAWLDALTAPLKRVEWFEDSGHEPFADEPEAFNARMIDLVRPLAT